MLRNSAAMEALKGVHRAFDMPYDKVLPRRVDN